MNIQTTEPSNIVIFGASGDLTKRKLMPALYKMLRYDLLHPQSRVIGVARNVEQADWIDTIHQGLEKHLQGENLTEQGWQEFSAMLSMVPGDLSDDVTYQTLRESLDCIEGVRHVLFYLAIPPSWYQSVVQGLYKVDLQNEAEGYRRIVVEKPFGSDLASARQLNQVIQCVFDESQIYRIDHYLGKESVQNLMVYRFANSILEPLWNRNYIDHIQICAAESIGIEYRASYYEKSGALRDMIQSHLMQVMTLMAMEPPVEMTADAIRNEKMKVLRAIKRFDKPELIDQLTVAAQYASNRDPENPVNSYVSEPGVSPDSSTETFAAVRFRIDNWRWKGVPFIVWTGKRMESRVSEIMIRFKKPPFNMFDSEAKAPQANALVLRLHPDEGIVLRMNAKKPGLTTDIQRMVMRAPYAEDTGDLAEAYEVLLHDVLTGDATLFSRADEVEESWEIVEPILNAWQDRVSINRYRAGTWNVEGMDQLFHDCVSGWHKPG
jgi:glucose-6-phosphate 1-dehydrogenase